MSDPPISESVPASRSSTKAHVAYRKLGLLVWASLIACAVAAVLQHRSSLPGPYTWLEPLRTLRNVVRLPGFMVAVLAAYLLGRWEFRGNLDVESVVRSLRSRADVHALRPKLMAAVLGALLFVAVDAVLIGDERSFADFFALLLLGAVAGVSAPSLRRLKLLVGHTLVSVAIFSAICYAYTVVKALTFVNRPEVDAQLIALETSIFGAPPHRALATWAASHPGFVELCDWAYFRFFHHIALVTVLLVGLRQARERTEFLGALALCYLIGGPLYHLWPAKGPAFFEPNYFPYLANPSLVTHFIGSWLERNTTQIAAGQAKVLDTWGYLACMPSLHVAHEAVMLYYARRSPIAFTISIAFMALTLVSVVVLGWHYPLDALAGLVVAGLAIWIARSERDALFPASLMAITDEPIPTSKAVVLPLLRAVFRREPSPPSS